ncbi:MAG: hypothetical protein D6776_05275 [Planctomycetota bacterium]|nr:MAG: hypothetical protein D6776_05275 [Planctomycetota bacterium]
MTRTSPAVAVLGPIAALLALPALAAASEASTSAPTATAQPRIAPSTDPALVIGEFQLAPGGVIDGDTLRVKGLRRPLRLLMLDTEEVLHGDDLDAPLAKLMATDFDAYVARVTANAPLPVKYATPMGEEAKAWAERFFEGVKRVRLERDRPTDGVGNYGRTLCYVWALYDDGRPPRLYNLEAVRAGMSPYFIKYGRSQRFDAAFTAAQNEARAAGRGIFSDKTRHYPDYDRRLAWWSRRAAALEQLDRLRERGVDVVALGDRDAIHTLLRRQGQTVLVWGVIDDHDHDAVRIHDKGATLRVGGDYPIEVEIEGAELARTLGVRQLLGEAVFVRGRLDRGGSPLPARYQRKGKPVRHYLRIRVRDASALRPAHLGPPPTVGPDKAQPPSEDETSSR